MVQRACLVQSPHSLGLGNVFNLRRSTMYVFRKSLSFNADSSSMAEEGKWAPPQPSPPPLFFEVKCKSSGKTRRFAVGTDAEFAVILINSKLKAGDSVAYCIEAVKQGEEAIAFGPKSVLVDYGDGWKLQTYTEADLTFGSDVKPLSDNAIVEEQLGTVNPRCM